MKRIALCILTVVLCGCSREAPPPLAKSKSPHGGTPVALGEDNAMELVLDTNQGKLDAYILDDDMENFIRIPAKSIELQAGGQVFTLAAMASAATGETVGDTSQFEVQSPWFKTNAAFDGVVKQVIVHGVAFEKLAFHFPMDEK